MKNYNTDKIDIGKIRWLDNKDFWNGNYRIINVHWETSEEKKKMSYINRKTNNGEKYKIIVIIWRQNNFYQTMENSQNYGKKLL